MQPDKSLLKSYSILVDVSEAGKAGPEFVAQIKLQCRLARVTAFDSSGTTSPSAALTEALALAAEKHEPLVYLKYPLVVNDATVSALAKSMATDVMFSAVSPRFAQETTDLVYGLPGSDGSLSKPLLTRRALAVLPAHWITPEVSAGCILINPALVSNAPSILSYSSMSGVLLHFLAAVRRRGFRMVIDNRVVVRTGAKGDLVYPLLADHDRVLLQKALSGHFSNVTDETVDRNKTKFVDQVEDWYRQHPLHRLEALLAEAYPPPKTKRRILIDSRSMMVPYNGTTISQLGYLSGFQNFTDEWEIHVVAQEMPMKVHRLRERFPKLTFHEKFEGLYACAVHMSQPSFIGVVKDLHRHAFLVAGNILDTITWDMVLGAPADIGKVWNFVASYFDILFYISEFSRRQFNHRFPTREDMSEFVTYLSFKKSENTVDRIVPSVSAEKYILVFGNGYDHKDVEPTVRRVRESFPDMQIKAIGPMIEGLKCVQCFSSGSMSEDEIQKLIANCSAMIFPSWAEGFGMPVVNGLAYGKNVVVRHLPLWQEIATHSKALPGKLFEFRDRETLKTAVRHALDNSASFALRAESERTSEEVIDWAFCAKVILDGFRQHLETADSQLWLARHQMMELIS